MATSALLQANDAALKEYWHKYLKFETLSRVNDELKEQEEKGEEAEKKSFEEIEEEVRKDVLKMFNDWYDRMGKLKKRRSPELSISIP